MGKWLVRKLQRKLFFPPVFLFHHRGAILNLVGEKKRQTRETHTDTARAERLMSFNLILSHSKYWNRFVTTVWNNQNIFSPVHENKSWRSSIIMFDKDKLTTCMSHESIPESNSVIGGHAQRASSSTFRGVFVDWILAFFFESLLQCSGVPGQVPICVAACKRKSLGKHILNTVHNSH